METLNELRKELKKIGFNIKTEKLSWGRDATYIHMESGMPVSGGNVYNKSQAESFKPLLEFKETHKKELERIQENEDIIGII